MNDSIIIHPIGIIHTPFKDQQGTPIQPAVSKGTIGIIEIYPEFREGLRDLAGFERIWVIFWCHLSKGYKLRIIPYRDVVERGVFATRAPKRPNPIGISPVKLLSIDKENGILKIEGADILDGTPLLDIKPYIPSFDSYAKAKYGWLEHSEVKRETADNRFTNNN